MRAVFVFITFAAIALLSLSCRRSSDVSANDALGIAAEALINADGGESLLRYAVGCALPAGRSVHTAGGAQFEGSLGLAPDWAERPLIAAEQRWLSACLLARTNLFGIRVDISMRGTNAALIAITTPEEKALYTLEEGAFYGDLWATPPHAFVCLGRGTEATSDRLKRVCTDESEVAGISRCGFQIAGRCDDVCEDRGGDGAVLRCLGGGLSYEEVITTFLKSK